MIVVVLCGGLGTRLRSVVDDRPKVLAPVGDRPFLYFVLNQLRREGFEEVVLSTGYMGDAVEKAVDAFNMPDLRVRCVREPEPLGTAGGLRFAAEAAGIESAFLALNGDTLFTGSLERLAENHRERADAAATVAVVRTDDPQRYGTVQIDEDSGSVTAFVEKGASMVKQGWINAGAYVLEPESLDVLQRPSGSIERDVFPMLVGRGLYASRFPEAEFLDIGVPEDYRRAESFLKRIKR